MAPAIMIEITIILITLINAPGIVAQAWPISLASLAIPAAMWRPGGTSRAALVAAIGAMLVAIRPGAPEALRTAESWWISITVLVTIYSTQPRARVMRGVVLAGALAGALTMITALAIPSPRPAGVLANANVNASVLAIALVGGMVELPRQRTRRARLITLVATGLAAAGLIETRSVGAIAGVLAAGGVLVASRTRLPRITGLHRRHAMIAALVAVLVAVLVAAATAEPVYWGFVRYRLNSWADRVMLWDAGIRLAAAQPLGAGVGGFAVAIDHYKNHAHAHNLPITIAAELGLPGLAGLVGLAIPLVKRTPRDLWPVWTAIAVHSLVDATLLHQAPGAMAALVLAAGLQTTPGTRDRLQACSMIAAAVLLSLGADPRALFQWSM